MIKTWILVALVFACQEVCTPKSQWEINTCAQRCETEKEVCFFSHVPYGNSVSCYKK